MVGCNKKTASAKSGDAVDQKLQELAGSSAKDCGRIKHGSEANPKPASDCAMQSAQAKKPFYVAYDMPGLTVGVAESPDGKLYAIQSQSPQTDDQKPESQPVGQAQVTVTPCPAELRIASSGRVTCYPSGSFGTATGTNPHGGGMMMPPEGTMNPHGGNMTMPPPGTPNPHGTMEMPNSHGSATKGDKAASKDASKQ